MLPPGPDAAVITSEVAAHDLPHSALDDPMTLFRAAIKSKTTRYYYEKRFGAFLARLKMTPEQFLSKAREGPKWAETQVLGYVVDLRSRVEAGEITADTLPNYLKPIRVFLDMNDVALNWKRITRTYPRGRGVAQDRAPTPDEVRALAGSSDLRVKFAVLAMASGGFRLGAWDAMRFKHIMPLKRDGDVVAAKVTIYPGTADGYFTFISGEAWRVLEGYRRYREENGEKVGPDSPVLRDLFKKGRAHRPKPLAAFGVRSLINTRLWKLGIRTEKKARHDFQGAHGFRKFFKTHAETVMRPLHVEMLLGHSTGLSDNYYRPPEDQLLEDYLRALPHLTVLETTTAAPADVERMKLLEDTVHGLQLELSEMREALKPVSAVLDVLSPDMERLIGTKVDSLIQKARRRKGPRTVPRDRAPFPSENPPL